MQSPCRTAGDIRDLYRRFKKTAWIKLTNEYDIFINTTNIDNTPVSVIEAMALSLPVVSTNVGGIPFLIEDGKDALLSAPEDETSMYEHICQLIQNPEMARSIAINARKRSSLLTGRLLKSNGLTCLLKQPCSFSQYCN